MAQFKSAYLAAALLGAIVFSPVTAIAQVDQQVLDQLAQELTTLGITEPELAKLPNINEEQLVALQVAVEGEGTEQQKKDQVSAILAEVQ